MEEHLIIAEGQLGSKISEPVLVDLFFVYEYGIEKDLASNSFPGNIVCDVDGNFWAIWQRIFEIRSRIRKWNSREILFRKFKK